MRRIWTSCSRHLRATRSGGSALSGWDALLLHVGATQHIAASLHAAVKDYVTREHARSRAVIARGRRAWSSDSVVVRAIGRRRVRSKRKTRRFIARAILESAIDSRNDAFFQPAKQSIEAQKIVATIAVLSSLKIIVAVEQRVHRECREGHQ
jgi:hypothetical protein